MVPKDCPCFFVKASFRTPNQKRCLERMGPEGGCIAGPLQKGPQPVGSFTGCQRPRTELPCSFWGRKKRPQRPLEKIQTTLLINVHEDFDPFIAGDAFPWHERHVLFPSQSNTCSLVLQREQGQCPMAAFVNLHMVNVSHITPSCTAVEADEKAAYRRSISLSASRRT